MVSVLLGVRRDRAEESKVVPERNRELVVRDTCMRACMHMHGTW